MSPQANPRARVGRDYRTRPYPSHPLSFNPRARVGRDTRRQAMWDRTARFNPRALVGATWAVVDILAEVDVSIRAPRGTRLVALLIGVLLKLVSIHAPAWGATRVSANRISLASVSIHAPAWGATEHLGGGQLDLLVSIHVPAWGAT